MSSENQLNGAEVEIQIDWIENKVTNTPIQEHH
jgi:hypothetical protein